MAHIAHLTLHIDYYFLVNYGENCPELPHSFRREKLAHS